jgi:hypothetical protein
MEHPQTLDQICDDAGLKQVTHPPKSPLQLA